MFYCFDQNNIPTLCKSDNAERVGIPSRILKSVSSTSLLLLFFKFFFPLKYWKESTSDYAYMKILL